MAEERQNADLGQIPQIHSFIQFHIQLKYKVETWQHGYDYNLD